MSVTTSDPVEVMRAFDRNLLYPCKWCGDKSVEIGAKSSLMNSRHIYRFIHRCPPNLYEGSFNYDINDCAKEWNEYNKPKRVDSFLNANPCQFCGENDLWLDESFQDNLYFGKHESCANIFPFEFSMTGYNTPEEVLEAWNLANPLPESLETDKPILTPEELPALPFAPRRGKRLIEFSKQAIDLEMVEIEVGVREMRSYKNGKLVTQKEESVSLRARVKEGQTADQVYQALRLQAGQYVDNAHQAYEEDNQKRQAEDEATQKLLNSSSGNPSYSSPNPRRRDEDIPF